MDRTRTTADARRDARPVFYAGRFSGEVRAADLPENSVVLGDWDVLPADLAAAVRGAAAVVVLDAFSFPFEAMGEPGWDAPLTVVLPDDFDAGFLDAVFGAPVFERLGFFDRLVARDDAVWDALSSRYGWAPAQRLRPAATDKGDVAAELAKNLPESAAEKVLYRAQEAALGPRFTAARGDRAEDVPFAVLEVGVGDGRWMGSFDPGPTGFVGVGAGDPDALRAEYPGARFEAFGPDGGLPFGEEEFDLVFAVDVLGGHPVPEKRALVSEMWRVARPGGRLLFLEDFVAGEGLENTGGHVVGVRVFEGIVMDATAGRVTLEHVRSVRYPGEDLVRAGVVEFSKLGVPRRW